MHIFHEIQGVQKCGETLSEMFDMFFSIKAKTQGEKRETKLQKSMLIMRSGIQTPSCLQSFELFDEFEKM